MMRLVGGLTACCLATILSLSTAFAQDFPKPGKEHAELAKLAGKWKVTVVSGFNPGSSGVTEFKSVCNGMWVASDFRLDDGSFSGQGLDSYDPQKKKYVSVWADSMSGTPLVFEGDWTEPGKTMVMKAKGPAPDGSMAEYTSVTKHTSADKMNFTLSMKAGGAEINLIELNYDRMK